MKKLYTVATLLMFLIVPNVHAQSLTHDLGLTSDDISFSSDLIAGQKIRIYARIHNFGVKDVEAYVTFYQSSTLVGDSQVVSVRANGLADEVYVDFTVPEGSFNIRAEIRGQKPADENPANDIALTTLFIPQPDSDEDGIPDSQDPDDDNDGVADDREPLLGTDPTNPDTDGDGYTDGQDDFPTNPNETVDSDGDGKGDQSDPDDDNDGCTDVYEQQIGTQTHNPDTDGDGVLDCDDDFPLDASRSRKESPKPQPPAAEQQETALSSEGTEQNIQPVEQQEEAETMVQEVNLGEFSSNFPANSKLYVHVTKDSWNTYSFTPELQGFFSKQLTYEWDFGDGITSSDREATHTFSQAGTFDVRLTLNDPEYGVVGTAVPVTISFFNLGNTQFIGLLSALFVILIAIILLLLRKKKSVVIGNRPTER